jgi:hypothetical protein
MLCNLTQAVAMDLKCTIQEKTKLFRKSYDLTVDLRITKNAYRSAISTLKLKNEPLLKLADGSVVQIRHFMFFDPDNPGYVPEDKNAPPIGRHIFNFKTREQAEAAKRDIETKFAPINEAIEAEVVKREKK